MRVELPTREADLPTQHQKALPTPRFSPPDEFACGPSNSSRTAPSRKGKAVRLVGRVKDRQTFAEFRRSRLRGRSGPIRIAFVNTEGIRPEVAFSIGRKFGNAVQRNRIRRRIRAINEELGLCSLQSGSYLVGASAEASQMSHEELKSHVEAALQAIRLRVSR